MVNPINISTEEQDTLEKAIRFSLQNPGRSLHTSHKHGLRAVIDELLRVCFTDGSISQIYFTSTDSITQTLDGVLSDLGYEHLLLSHEGLQYIASKVQKIVTQQTKSWEHTLQKVELQYNLAIKPLAQHIRAIDLPILGERSFQTVILQYLIKTASGPMDFTLDTTLKLTDYALDKKEYWLLKGRITTATQLYRTGYLDHPVFEAFHPVVFDMLTPKEARHLVQDQLQGGICKLRDSKMHLQSLLIDYKSKLSRHYQEMIQSMMNQFADISYEIEQLKLDENTASRDNIITKWVSKNPLTPRKAQLFSRYEKLCSEWNQSIFSKGMHLPEVDNYNKLVGIINDLNVERYDWASFLQMYIAHHMERLTVKNGMAPFFSRDKIDAINKNIRDNLNEINQNKIFKNAIEDNTLYLQNRLHFLDKTIQKWQDTLTQVNQIEPYHAWRKFWDQQEAALKNLVLTLSKYEKDQWIHQFETWYFRMILEKNVHPSMLSNFTALDHLSQSAKRRKNAYRLFIQDNKVKQFKQKFIKLSQDNPPLKKWKNQNFPNNRIDNRTLLQLAQLFPIRYLNNKEDIRVSDSALIVSIEASNEQYTIRCSMGGVPQEEATGDSNHVNYCLPPEIKKSIVLSQHSDRWESLKEISSFLTSEYPEMAFYESKECFILTLFENALIHKLIRASMDISLHRYPTSDRTEKQKSLAEALLNNNRPLYFVTLDGALKKVHHALDYRNDYHTILLLKNAGIKPIDIWSKDIHIWHKFEQNNPFTFSDVKIKNDEVPTDQKFITQIIQDQ